MSLSLELGAALIFKQRIIQEFLVIKCYGPYGTERIGRRPHFGLSPHGQRLGLGNLFADLKEVAALFDVLFIFCFLFIYLFCHDLWLVTTKLGKKYFLFKLCYVYNIFTINYRWLVVIGSNLKLTLKLLFCPNTKITFLP